MTNKQIWDQVSQTDPAHTKSFTRKGGFSGTAIRPMSSIEKMTEVFGPCGIGWGYTKPEFEISLEHEGQKLVYCTLGLWYELDGKRSDPVYGCGGDFAVGANSKGLNPDDEAFKKSFTDALMNAMKHIGMAADIHMGQFDASKYIAPKQKSDRLANSVQGDMKDLGYDAKAIYEAVLEELSTCDDSETLKLWVARNKDTRRMQGLPDDLKQDVTDKYSRLKISFESKGK